MEYYNTDFALSTPPVVTELPRPLLRRLSGPGAGEPVWRLLRNQCAAALVLCALLLSMEFWWPSGVQTARKWLICQEVGPLEAAAQAFVQEVVQGDPCLRRRHSFLRGGAGLCLSPRLLTRSRMRVRISPWFPVLLCAFYRLDPVGCFWPFLGAAAIHEVGHCLAVLLCGGSIHSLALTARGAVLQTSPLSYRQEALCALAGPCAGFFAALLGPPGSLAGILGA